MAETPEEEKGQYWCFDGSSWRLIDDPLPPPPGTGSSLFEIYGEVGFELLLGPGDEADGHGAHMSLWTRPRRGKPECLINIFHGGDGGTCEFAYADRLPDGIDLFARWASAIHAHGGEPASEPGAST